MQNIGVDGCKVGWVACWRERDALKFQIFANFNVLIEAFDQKARFAVDMPIGLPERVGAGGRGPEGLIRPLLGQRKSSVFSIPSRRAVYAQTYPEACAAAFESSNPQRKISKQGFFLFPKIREIDAALCADETLRLRVFETHPELIFCKLKKQPLQLSKKTPDGAEERTKLLRQFGLPIEDWPKLKGAAQDDIIDAAACLVTAEQISADVATSLPAKPALDSFGIPIAIWA